MVWYSHLLKNFPQFIVIHTVKVFDIVDKTEIDVFLELSCFSMIQRMLAIVYAKYLPWYQTATKLPTNNTCCLYRLWSLAGKDAPRDALK